MASPTGTRVVNVRAASIRPKHADLRAWCADPQNVYVGRRGVVLLEGARYPPRDSPFANPFRISEAVPREGVIQKYREYITGRLAREPALRQELAALRGKTLGCWCAPEPCHADVLAALCEEQ